MRRKPLAVPSIRTVDGPLVTSTEQCQAFASHYRDISGPARSAHGPVLAARIRQHVDDIDSTLLQAEEIPSISRRAVEIEIKALRNGKTLGFDGITAQHIKHLPSSAVMLLVSIFNSCLRLGHFPRQWKLSKVIGICKPGKPPEEVASYRFLSLLPSFGKLYERMLLPFITHRALPPPTEPLSVAVRSAVKL